MGRGSAEAPTTLQSQTSRQFSSSSDFGKWQLGDCHWGILLPTAWQELSCPWSSPSSLLVGSQGDPMETVGDQMPPTGKPNPASQSKAGPGPAPSGNLVSVKRMRECGGGLCLHKVIHIQSDVTLRPFWGGDRSV